MIAEQDNFASWYERAHPRVATTLAVATGDHPLVADAVQEAFVRAFARWNRVSLMRNPTGWTYKVARNHLNRLIRRATREIPTASPPESEWQQPNSDPQLWRAVRELPERQREAVALRYIADLTQAEVARAMGIRPGTAAATLVAARRHLAGKLTQEETHP